MKRKKKKGWQQVCISFLLGLFCFILLQLFQAAVPTGLPEENGAVLLYSNQMQHDLRALTLRSIEEAQQSILLIIYSLTDPAIIQKLKQKAAEGVEVQVICDVRASPDIREELGAGVNVHRQFSKGLMHQKILVVDKACNWIGSANYTRDSLQLHGNLVTGIYSKTLAEWICQKAENMKDEGVSVPSQEFILGGQRLELSFFPDDKKGVQRLKQLLRTAEKSVRVAMFTWTRQDLAEEMYAAKKRGLHVEAVIDHHSGKGVSAKVVQFLKEHGISVRLSSGSGLLHHKMLYIDRKVLVNGSANWTKAAFTKNEDCFIILHDLTDEQQEQLENLWDAIRRDSVAA